MAKYTEIFADFLNNGGELPAVFSQIDGFGDLFVAHYCDKEIGFETEQLFNIKLQERAEIIIPAYVKRIAATDVAWLVVGEPKRKQTTTSTRDDTDTKTFTSGEKQSETRALPLNSQTAQPSQTATAKQYVDTDETKRVYNDTDTTEYEGMTTDEAIRRVEYYQNLDGTAWILLNSCLREFENLFMKVY